QNFSWNYENAKNAWSEHPVLSAIELATVALPGISAITKAKRLSKFAGINSGELRALGRIDEGVDLATMSKQNQEILRRQVYHIDKAKALEEKIQAGTATKQEVMLNEFNQQFGNEWAVMADPYQTIKERSNYMERVMAVTKSKEMVQHLGDMPKDAALGPAVARYLLDPSNIKNIPSEHRPWVINLASDMRATQRTALEEGFIDEATYEAIGDVWFPAYRENTRLLNQGPTTSMLIKGKGGKVSQINVPRTSSPSLLSRSASKADIKDTLLRQEAVGHLKSSSPQQATKLLKGKHDDEVALIKAGKFDEAIENLSAKGQGHFLQMTPEDLTVGGILQQKLLFENFRYVRDISMNANFAKKTDEIMALTPAARKGWINLNEKLPNANIVRRMVEKAGGDPGELGWVRKELWSELVDITGGMASARNDSVSLLELMTTIHKTSKTALNPFTHGQNVFGNFVFLSQAGFSLSDPTNWGTFKTSWKAIDRLYAARRKGSGLEALKDLGRIPSDVSPGKFIDITEEFNNPLVKEMIEISSIEAAEGLKALARAASESTNANMFTRKIAQGMMKASTKGPHSRATVEAVSDLYMAEDGAAKLAYYLHLRKGGLSSEAAVMEVARRLPMYHSVGAFVADKRKVLLPWLSFPAEAMRITKNNLMDYPLRTASWFHASKALQALIYPTLGMSAEGIEDVKSNLPVWAQKPTGSIVTPVRDANNDLRAAMVDFLPHAAFLPQTIAPEAPLIQKLPLGLNSPVPIVMGMVNAVTGKDSWGNDIPTNSMGQAVRNGVVNTLGFMAPPIVQKYLMSTTSPDLLYKGKQDAGFAINPATNKPGDWRFDVINNNIFTLGKMYASSPEQGLSNVSFAKRRLDQYRAKKNKHYAAYVKSGDTEGAAEALADIQRTYLQQYQDPGIANGKFFEWMKRNSKTLLNHPQLRGYSKEDLEAQLVALQGPTGQVRSEALAGRMAAMRQEIGMRGVK
ncbi:MAG: hypothetical protein ACXABY_13725, partial [Candidatus Thorarchaeota archaeon]